MTLLVSECASLRANSKDINWTDIRTSWCTQEVPKHLAVYLPCSHFSTCEFGLINWIEVVRFSEPSVTMYRTARAITHKTTVQILPCTIHSFTIPSSNVIILKVFGNIRLIFNNSAWKRRTAFTAVRRHLRNSAHIGHEFSFISFFHVCYAAWFFSTMLPDIIYLDYTKFYKRQTYQQFSPFISLPFTFIHSSQVWRLGIGELLEDIDFRGLFDGFLLGF